MASNDLPVTSASPSTKKKVLPEQVGTYVVGLSEELKKVYPYTNSGEKCHPELIVGRSEILDIDDVENITKHILGDTPWSLVYSTSLHQHSLSGMYKKLQSYYENSQDHHLLILVKDVSKRLFGVFISTKLECLTDKYPAENTVIFQCRPSFELIGENQCVITCRQDSLEIGHSDGRYGIWLNEGLTIGRWEEGHKTKIEIVPSDPNSLKLKPHPFKIKTLECWIFGSK